MQSGGTTFSPRNEESHVEIAGPHFEIDEIVAPTEDAAIKPASRVGRVESRSWVEFPGQPGYWRYSIRWPGGGTSNELAKHLQPADAIGCDLEVVVSGHPIKLETSTTATVAELIEQAHLKADVALHPEMKWGLRTQAGQVLTRLVGDVEQLVDGETVLYLDPQVGGGAERGEVGHVGDPGVPGDVANRIDTAEEIPPTPMRHTRHFFTEAEIADGWHGDPPAEGTRRKLIFDTLLRLRLDNATHPERIFELADEIEQALIDATGLPTEVEQEFRRLQADVEAKQVTIDGFAATISEQAHQLDATRGRTNAWVTELAYQAAGAATRPLLEDHGDYVFPAERVQEAVAHLLETYFGIPRACGGCQEEQLEQGRQEAPTPAADDAPGGDDPAATIKYLEGEVERLLGHREEARTREGRFGEERDCAYALLRWLLPVTVAKRLD
jgi:hypothetical protein